MDKFLTFPGQQPIYLGDIDFMQTAVGKALKNLLISYTGNADGSAILAGVELSVDGADISWTEGVVAIEGDILPVAAGTITGGASSTLYFNVVATLSGSRTMKDGTVRQCWQTKSAVVTTEATDYPVLDFGRAGLAQKATVYTFAYTQTTSSNYAYLANCGGAWIFAFRRTAAYEYTGNSLYTGIVENLPAEIIQKLTTGRVSFPVMILPGTNNTSFVAPALGSVALMTSSDGRLVFQVYSNETTTLAANDAVCLEFIIPKF